MKFVIAMLLIVTAFQTQAASFQRSRICKDQYTREFPGTLFMSVENRIIQKVWYAEKVTEGSKPVYREIKSLIPDPANKYSKGGSEYTVEIETSKGTIAGKMDITTLGSVNLSMDHEEFVLTCEPAN